MKPSWDTYSSEALILQYKTSRDVDAFSELHRRHAAQVLHYLVWLGMPPTQAADASQEVFIKVFQHAEQFDDHKLFKPWLITIAKNVWKNQLRADASRPRMSSAAVIPEIPKLQVLQDREQDLRIQAIHHSLNQLPPKQKEVMILKYGSNFTLEEMADILACSVGTVKSRLFYAIKNVKNYVRR